MRRPALTHAAMAVVQFMVSLDRSFVNVGLPRIAGGPGSSAVGVTWLINAHVLTFGRLPLGRPRRHRTHRASPEEETR